MGNNQTTDRRKIRVIISFVDGETLNTAIDAEEGAFSFRVLPGCPTIASVDIKAPGSKVEFMSER